MNRRAFIGIVGGSILATPLAAEAQLTGKPEATLAFFDTVEGTPPRLIIAATEIMSVMVEPNKNGYRTTIRIDSNAARRLFQFTERNIGKRVDIRFDRERLSALTIVAPVSSGSSFLTWCRPKRESTRSLPRLDQSSCGSEITGDGNGGIE